ncbi:MAG: T9SS type A sorting domain-containing protein [Candidatus Delongbacteria bacterium]
MKPSHACLFAALCWPAFASAQELPLAWPDRPAGTVLYVAPTAAFNGATLPMGDDHLLLAWSDMRDGRGRLMLQSYSLDHPAAGGEWTTEVDGLGTVRALAHEPSVLTPFMPILTADGQGGAYVLWHEMLTEGWGELRLQRVSAAGQFLWPEDRLVAPAVPVPENDCRDAAERCRTWTDDLRWMVADDQGVWVTWVDLDRRRWTLRLGTDGQVAPGFPPTGVELTPGDLSRQFHSRGTTLLYAWQEGNPPAVRGRVQGLLPDGSPLFPAGALALTPDGASVNEFTLRPAGAGNWLAAWLDDNQLRVQLFDAALHAQWAAGGIVAGTGANNFHLLTGLETGPPWFVVFQQNTGWLAQRLAADGALVWPQPAALAVLPGEEQGWMAGASQDEQGLVYRHSEGQLDYLQRLSADGTQLWSPALAQLESTPGSGFVHDMGSTPNGEVWICWRELGEEGERVLLRRRDLSGAELLTPADGLALDLGPVAESCLSPLVEDDSILVPWVANSRVYLLSVDPVSGAPAWGCLERPLGYHEHWKSPPVAPTEAGLWLGTVTYQQEPPQSLLFLQRTDLQGQLTLPSTVVFPTLPDTLDVFNWRLATLGEDVVAAAHSWTSSGSQIRLQRMDSAGNRLWGDAGVLLPTGGSSISLDFGMVAGPSGVLVVWSTGGASPSIYLQKLDGNGVPQFSDHNGLGRRLDLPLAPWSGSRFSELSDGGLLISSPVSQVLHLLRLDPAGEELGGVELPGHLTPGTATLDAAGRLWYAHEIRVEQADSLQVVRVDAGGGESGRWTWPLDGNLLLDAAAFVFTGTQTALVAVSGEYSDELGPQAAAYLLDEDGSIGTLFDAPIHPVPYVAGQPRLVAAPAGDVLLQWRDLRGSAQGYGYQTRLARLDVLDPGTPVSPTTRPARLQVASVHPNPFNPVTQVEIMLPEAGALTLTVYDLAGRRVYGPETAWAPAGLSRQRLDLTGHASGLYVLSAEHAQDRVSRKLLLVK